jgi:hypothetical protein
VEHFWKQEAQTERDERGERPGLEEEPSPSKGIPMNLTRRAKTESARSERFAPVLSGPSVPRLRS